MPWWGIPVIALSGAAIAIKAMFEFTALEARVARKKAVGKAYLEAADELLALPKESKVKALLLIMTTDFIAGIEEGSH